MARFRSSPPASPPVVSATLCAALLSPHLSETFSGTSAVVPSSFLASRAAQNAAVTPTAPMLRADDVPSFHRRRPFISAAIWAEDTPGGGGGDNAADGSEHSPAKKKKKKKKKKFVVRTDVAGEDGGVSSDGLLEDRPRRDPASADGRSNLGFPSKRRMKDRNDSSGADSGRRRQSAKAAKIQRQRTAGGSVDSSSAKMLEAPKEEQNVQVQTARRGNKAVTMVRGLISPMDERKKLLKEMKSKLGGGGTLVDGVLELQGDHAEKILALLKGKGFAKAKVVGK